MTVAAVSHDAPRTGAIKIGTRGSRLALAQAHEVRQRLMDAHGRPHDQFEICIIKTSGDQIQDRPLSEAGGKGLFTKEIEEALLAGRIDLAVHSMKDMPTVLPDRLEIACLLPREDVRDAFISFVAESVAALPRHAIVGTSSLRRQAQIRRLRPDLQIIPFRGQVETRLRKLGEGQAAATLLACAGLKRLGMEHRITQRIPVEDMLPAVAQGAIGIEVRTGDVAMRELLVPLDHAPTTIAISAERAFLARLDGSCRTPIAALATLDDRGVNLRGMILAADGSQIFETTRLGSARDASRMGRDAAEELLARAGSGFLAAFRGVSQGWHA